MKTIYTIIRLFFRVLFIGTIFVAFGFGLLTAFIFGVGTTAFIAGMCNEMDNTINPKLQHNPVTGRLEPKNY